jgi:hypothetical protein
VKSKLVALGKDNKEAKEEQEEPVDEEKRDKHEHADAIGKQREGGQGTRMLWVTKAKAQSYIQEAKLTGGKSLIIAVSEKMSPNHHKIIDLIKDALMKDLTMGKKEAKALREDLVGNDLDSGR